MTTLNTAAHRSAETLRAAIAGEVFVPGEAGYILGGGIGWLARRYGHPLYTFAGDASPGVTNGQGYEAFGARWDVLTPAGQEVTGG